MNTILTTVYTKGSRRTDAVESATETHRQECLARLEAKKPKKGKKSTYRC